MMKTTPNVPAIVTLAIAITKLQAERAKAMARLAVVNAEREKLEATLRNANTAQLTAQREMDRLSAQQNP